MTQSKDRKRPMSKANRKLLEDVLLALQSAKAAIDDPRTPKTTVEALGKVLMDYKYRRGAFDPRAVARRVRAAQRQRPRVRA